MTMTAIQADITTLRVDAIVNAANGTLLGGPGARAAQVRLCSYWTNRNRFTHEIDG